MDYWNFIRGYYYYGLIIILTGRANRLNRNGFWSILLTSLNDGHQKLTNCLTPGTELN